MQFYIYTSPDFKKAYDLRSLYDEDREELSVESLIKFELPTSMNTLGGKSYNDEVIRTINSNISIEAKKVVISENKNSLVFPQSTNVANK